MVDNDLTTLELREFDAVRGPEALGDIMEHLATYLLEGDLCDAKFLWKRIPNSYKESQELNAIWGVGQALWLRDMPEFYNRVRSFDWNPRIQSIMARIVGSVGLWFSANNNCCICVGSCHSDTMFVSCHFDSVGPGENGSANWYSLHLNSPFGCSSLVGSVHC